MKLEHAFASLDRQMNKLWRTMDLPKEIGQLSWNEYDYLKSIQHLGNPRLSEVAKDLAVQKPSASNMITRLESKGFVRRSPCPTDGRATRVSLTEKGEKLMSYDEMFYSSLASTIRNKLSDVEALELERLLSQVVNRS